VFVTGHGDKAMFDHALDLGIKGFIVKPLAQQKLYDTLRKIQLINA